MPPLENTRHERFAQELAKGASATEAYETAGYSGSEPAMRSGASRLLTNANIDERVRELQSKAAKRVEITVESLCDELDEAKRLARENAQPAAMVTAIMGKAKITGHLIEKQQHSGPDGGPIVVSEIVLRGVRSQPHD